MSSFALELVPPCILRHHKGRGWMMEDCLCFPIVVHLVAVTASGALGTEPTKNTQRNEKKKHFVQEVLMMLYDRC